MTITTEPIIKIPENFEVFCKDYLDEIIKFACKQNDKITQTLNNCFERLEAIANNCKSHVNLYKDFAPYSFYFVIPNIMNGGIIFHGSHDNGGDGSAPTFSVNLSSVDGWTIHT